MKIDENKMYVVEGIALGYFQRVMERLYSDHKPWELGERRDLANGMNAHFYSHVHEYKPEEQT